MMFYLIHQYDKIFQIKLWIRDEENSYQVRQLLAGCSLEDVH